MMTRIVEHRLPGLVPTWPPSLLSPSKRGLLPHSVVRSSPRSDMERAMFQAPASPPCSFCVLHCGAFPLCIGACWVGVLGGPGPSREAETGSACVMPGWKFRVWGVVRGSGPAPGTCQLSVGRPCPAGMLSAQPSSRTSPQHPDSLSRKETGGQLLPWGAGECVLIHSLSQRLLQGLPRLRQSLLTSFLVSHRD